MKLINRHLWIPLILSLFILAGFDYSKHNIPLSEIFGGGPPKDGIPALTDPRFIESKDAEFLNADDRVLGLMQNGRAKAYPVKILNWHEVVNDKIKGKPVLITYCPLTGSGIAFDSVIKNKRQYFGVSGKLYNSNLLLYDKESESLWSQLKMKSVTGEKTDSKLQQIAIEETSWKDWKSRYPNTKVLSISTGHNRNYSRNPYSGYEKTDSIYFPVSNEDTRLKPKDYVLGIIIDGRAKAYPLSLLKKRSSPLEDKVGETQLLIHFNKTNNSAFAESKSGNTILSVRVFWFAWSAFYPDTLLFTK